MAPRIVAVYSRRWEPQWMVDELKENLSWVDAIIEYDDRDRPKEDLWCDEAQRYRWFHKKAGELDATFVLGTAPDERWDRTSPRQIRQAMSRYGRAYFSFRVYELYTPTQYRTDGNWARHAQQRIYRWDEKQQFPDGKLHHAIVPPPLPDQYVRSLPPIIYHLKHIEPQNRIRRYEMFKQLDANEQYCNHEGYDYLIDEQHIRLEDIPTPYYPPYTKKYVWDPNAKI